MEQLQPMTASLQTLLEAVEHLDQQEKAFLAGYAWAQSMHGDNRQSSMQSASPQQESAKKITILSASQTGNAREVAQQLSDKLTENGLRVELISCGDYKAKKIAQEEIVILITSTQGDGEPPEEALSLFKFLQSKRAPQLTQLQFAILALGDSSYPEFCQAGKDFEKSLINLGAQSLLARVDADLDYQTTADKWMDDIRNILQILSPSAQQDAKKIPVPGVQTVKYSKAHPYTAQLITRQKITAKNAIKDVQHIEIDIADSGLTYQPGDALGVWYENSPSLVNEMLQLHQLQGDEQILDKSGVKLDIESALKTQLDITNSTPKIIEHYAQLSQSKSLLSEIEDKDIFKVFVTLHPPVILFKDYPYKLSAQTLYDLLRPLTPRLYSIASAQDMVDDEVHLTVGVLRYNYADQSYTGGASGYLGEQLTENADLKIYIESNPRFKLPKSEDSILMIGAGTGIAPFRAFMQQRENDQATGFNWLIFGNTRFTDDFLYQAEWLDWRKQGLLYRADLAWSRQGEEKIYVQDKILEAGQALWDYMTSDAYIYICGDALKMAKSVEKALMTLGKKYAGYNEEAAQSWLDELRESGRLQKDVY